MSARSVAKTEVDGHAILLHIQFRHVVGLHSMLMAHAVEF